jgi:Protein of unknown function (DUF3500)
MYSGHSYEVAHLRHIGHSELTNWRSMIILTCSSDVLYWSHNEAGFSHVAVLGVLGVLEKAMWIAGMITLRPIGSSRNVATSYLPSVHKCDRFLVHLNPELLSESRFLLRQYGERSKTRPQITRLTQGVDIRIPLRCRRRSLDRAKFTVRTQLKTMTIETPDQSRNMGNDSSRAVAPFRDLIPPPGHPRIKSLPGCNALEWYEQKKSAPELAWFLKRFPIENLDKTYRGITADGHVREGVFNHASDEGAPVEAMVTATENLLSLLSPEQKTATMFTSVEADEMRIWSNPELYVNPGGIRLDECAEPIQTAVHGVLQASLSSAGYAKVLGCCLTNDFLGDLVNGKGVLNKHSYNFRLFGSPGLCQPWAYTFFGHHLCLAVFTQGKRMVIGPTFFGAEPDHIDEGPHAGLRLFDAEEHLSLKLMQSLSPELQAKSTLSKSMESLPEGRWNQFDERHLGGATQDNRVVPYG